MALSGCATHTIKEPMPRQKQIAPQLDPLPESFSRQEDANFLKGLLNTLSEKPAEQMD
jgi:hypothetical protein